MGVSDRFQVLLARIEPTAAELAKYSGHRDTVRRRLQTVFPDSKVELIGSHARGSAIKNKSDLDLMFHLPKSEATWGGQLVGSRTVLNHVRTQLQDRYTQTAVRRDAQAVVVPFGDGAFDVDVVPAVFKGMIDAGPKGANRPLFFIPDGQGGWLRTSPRAHNDYIGAADEQSRGKLKHVARLVKFWRTCREPNTPLLSFHLELLLAQERICAGVRSYAQCVAEVFHVLAKRQLRGLQDPIGISGLVRAVDTDAKLEAALATVDKCAMHAAKAVAAEENRDLEEAYRQWQIVFNNAFPAR